LISVFIEWGNGCVVRLVSTYTPDTDHGDRWIRQSVTPGLWLFHLLLSRAGVSPMAKPQTLLNKSIEGLCDDMLRRCSQLAAGDFTVTQARKGRRSPLQCPVLASKGFGNRTGFDHLPVKGRGGMGVTRSLHGVHPQ
jgi:hypothetical protein